MSRRVIVHVEMTDYWVVVVEMRRTWSSTASSPSPEERDDSMKFQIHAVSKVRMAW